MSAPPDFGRNYYQVALSLDGRDTRQVLANGAFADVEFAHIIESFAGVLGNPLSMTITKRQYDFAMRELLPRVMQWSPEDQKKMSYFLSRLFYAYEQAGQDSVATDELLVGLSLLVKGSKTYKLQSFWSHFATGSSSDGEETVQQAELARLLSALLTGLFSVCKISNNYDENMIGHAVHRRAVRTALDVFRELGVEDSEPITFDMFGAWYNEFGFEVVQWLELLDLQKWPLSSMMEEVSQAIDTYTGDGEMLAYNDVRGDEGGEDDDPVQLSFDFPECSAGRISFKESDVERLAQVISLTELHLKSPKSVAQVFFDASEEMILDRAQFDECVQYVMPLEELADQARLDEKEILIIAEQLVNRFSVFFSAFERHPGSGVNKEELAAGFSLLCQGNKSEKLNHAWNIIASGSEEGRLTRRGLWRFLRSFLQMLLAASGEVASSPSDISTTADQGAVTTAALVFADADRAYEHSVSFDEFAQWYTHGGFRAASWFELLDLKKWVIESPEEPALEYSGMRSSSAKVQTADSDEDSDGVDAAIEAADSLNQVDEVSADYDEYDEYEYDDDDDDTDEINDGAVVEGTSPICFTFSLTTVGHCLNIVQADVDFVMHIVTSSHFYELTPERAASVLMWYMDGNEGGQAFYSRGDESSLAKISYNKAMRDMLPRVAECGQETVKFLTYALSNIFYFFVPEGQNQAPMAEVATALSLFCQGSKSAKLQQGFTNFAWPAESESEEERMDGIQLRRFLSSILSVLFTCCRHTGVLQLNEAREIVAFAVEELAVRIMSRARRMLSVHDDTMVITFEDFGAWYNEEGCDDAPWLELLDLRKWQPSPAADDNKYDKPEDLDEHEIMEGLDATRFSFALLDAQGEPSSFILRISESDISSIRYE